MELPTNGRKGSPYRRVNEEVLTPNKFRRVLDTIHAKIIRNKVLPQTVSTGGDYSTRAKAKGFSLFLEGLLATEGVPYIQVDAPSYTRFLLRDRVQQMRREGIDPAHEFDAVVEADNRILRAAKRGGATTALHICHGKIGRAHV